MNPSGVAATTPATVSGHQKRGRAPTCLTRADCDVASAMASAATPRSQSSWRPQVTAPASVTAAAFASA